MGAWAGGYPRRVPEIRAATVDDAEQVFELLDARSRAAFGASEVSRPLVLAELRRSVDDRFVAEENGRVVGYAHVRPTHDVVVATGDARPATRCSRASRSGRASTELAAIEATVVAADAPFHSLVQRAGFVHERVILRMWRLLDEEVAAPTWPEARPCGRMTTTTARR